MQNRFQKVRVGIFVIVCILFFMVGVSILSGQKSFFESDYRLYARFTDISGLRSGAPVYLAGIGIGTVEEISFPHSLDEKEVIVKLKVVSRFKNRIRQDSEAMISTQGLLGDKLILLTVGSPTYPELKDGEHLKIKNGFSIEAISAKGDVLFEEVQKLTKNINQTLTDMREKQSLTNSLLYDPKGKIVLDDLIVISQSTRRIVEKIEKGDNLVHTLIFDKEGAKIAKDLKVTLKSLNQTTLNLEKMTSKIAKGEGSIGGLLNDPTVYYDLKALLGGANRSKLLQAVMRHFIQENEKQTLK